MRCEDGRVLVGELTAVLGEVKAERRLACGVRCVPPGRRALAMTDV